MVEQLCLVHHKDVSAVAQKVHPDCVKSASLLYHNEGEPGGWRVANETVLEPIIDT